MGRTRRQWTRGPGEFHESGVERSLAAPSGLLRPLFPQSVAAMSFGAIGFRWVGDGAHVELSKSRAFGSIERTVTGSGQGLVERPLEAGIWYWRVSGEDTKSSSAVWPLCVVTSTRAPVRQGLLTRWDYELANGDTGMSITW